MTATATTFPVRVTVAEAWDQVTLAVEGGTTIAEVKRLALERALGRRTVAADDYLVKFRGGAVLDESVTLGALGVPPNGPLIVLPARRRPVR